MSAFRIRADFESLGRVGKTFNQQAEATKKTVSKLKHHMSTLQSGDWVGKGAKQFYDDMDSGLLPGLNRLIKALESGDSAMQKVQKIMRQANDDLVALYRVDDLGGLMTGLRAGLTAANAAVAGAIGGEGAAAGAGGGGGGAGGGAGGQVFGASFLQGLIGIQIQGAGPQLGQLMGSLSQNPTGDQVTSILIEISDLRGRPLIEIQIEFGTFQDMQAQQAAGAAADSAAAAQPEPTAGGGGGGGQGFQGSMSQMRYGKVVGDALGVDPVFGAMLNPSGGLIGPGKYAIAGGNTPVGYHAVAQSAAGYLHQSHGIGPGLNYTGQGQSSAPAASHLAGIGYWRGATGGSSPVGGSSGWALGSVAGKVDMAGSVLRGVKSVF
jgi:WXG100 family type VII secretion target